MADALKEYHEKRDFKRTTEPSGDKPRRSKKPIFVVQRHDASTLHFDFRLEVEGVLKSWAVPKGPPIESHDRRLAVPTEDHPLEYAQFAGTIPKGAYGAGTVEIWDSGTYRNLREKDAEESVSMTAALEEGKIEVLLEGRKLNGKYALIRMAADEGDEDEEGHWLWLKMKDGNGDK